MSTDSNLVPASFDPVALQQAVATLGEALVALDAHERQSRVKSRAAIREKARTGRLKPRLGQASATGPVAAEVVLQTGTGTLNLDALEELASIAIGVAPANQEPA